MKNEYLIPFGQCQDIDFSKCNSIDVTVLHETGHLIVMYALDMMDYFESITSNAGSHINEVNGNVDRTDGLTDVTPAYNEKMQQYTNELLQMAGNQTSGAATTEFIRKIKVQGVALCLPNICRLFGGGAICRYYGIPDENMCKIDYDLIDTILFGLGIPGTREKMRILVDMYLKYVFESFDHLTKAIYKNLKLKGTLDRSQVMQIIAEWEELNY